MIGLLILAFSSCKKSPETIGNNLISENNYIDVYHTDTIAVVCHSYMDSVATRNTTNALIGAMKDPVFGGGPELWQQSGRRLVGAPTLYLRLLW